MINKKYIASVSREESEIFVEKVLTLRNLINNSQKPVINTGDIFHSLGDEILQIGVDDESMTYIGIIRSVGEMDITMEFINDLGILDGKQKIKIYEIRTIQIKNDYIDAMSVLLNDKTNR